MPGRGPAPSTNRRRANVPERGDWQPSPGIGWQHGDIPPCPVRGVAAKTAWQTWFQSWFASNWTPDDLPMLRQIVKLFAAIDAGRDRTGMRTEFRQLADSYGITPKGQQDRRWVRPKAAEPEPVTSDVAPAAGLYRHLRSVGD